MASIPLRRARKCQICFNDFSLHPFRSVGGFFTQLIEQSRVLDCDEGLVGKGGGRVTNKGKGDCKVTNAINRVG
jgi:hypothetical protein